MRCHAIRSGAAEPGRAGRGRWSGAALFGGSARRRARVCAALCGFVLLLGQAGWGRIIRVPEDYTKIDTARFYAQAGDEVVVAPGIYRENLTLTRPGITIRSQFNGDWAVVRNTIVEFDNGAAAVWVTTSTAMNCKLRGFTIRNSQIAIQGYPGVNLSLEYNIITKNAIQDYQDDCVINNCDGLIQNNIVEYNDAALGAAFRGCNGVIQNNLIRGNYGGAFLNCNGVIRNNTIVDNYAYDYYPTPFESSHYIFRGPGGLVGCKGVIVNNIIYSTTITQAVEYASNSEPSNCLSRFALPAAWKNIAGDPKFVDAAGGDFRLRADSPCIDAGIGAAGLRWDLLGVQRGLKAAGAPARGDGSGMDIGAYEALPKPVAVWLAGGGPGAIWEGMALTVDWTMDAAAAGNTIRLRLYHRGMMMAELGTFSGVGGAGRAVVRLPQRMVTGTGYVIVGRSVERGGYEGATPELRITGTRVNAVNGDGEGGWGRYE